MLVERADGPLSMAWIDLQKVGKQFIKVRVLSHLSAKGLFCSSCIDLLLFSTSLYRRLYMGQSLSSHAPSDHFQISFYFKTAPWKSFSVPCVCASALRTGSSPACQNGSCSIWFLSRESWQSHREPSVLSRKAGEPKNLHLRLFSYACASVTVQITECPASNTLGPSGNTLPSQSHPVGWIGMISLLEKGHKCAPQLMHHIQAWELLAHSCRRSGHHMQVSLRQTMIFLHKFDVFGEITEL